MIAFAGPSLPNELDAEWTTLLATVELRPPAQRGDILRALGDQPDCLVVLDGYYYTVPAVTHKELLYALDSGVRVIGAASMGALRAAELAPMGMEGVGDVFAAYRDGVIDGDDEVAVWHAPVELRYQSLTRALVEIRHAVAQLQRQEGVSERAGQRLVTEVKRLPFMDRSHERVFELATRWLGPARAARLESLLNDDGLKRHDARQALQLALGDRVAPITRAEPHVTTFLSHYREWHIGPARSNEPEASSPVYLEAWNATQVLHPTVHRFVRRLRVRFLLSSAARYQELEPSPSRIREVRRRLRAHLDRYPSLRLPQTEVEEEATEQALAETARAAFGGVAGALRRLAARLGLDPEEETGVLIRLLEIQDDLLPSWHLVRAFLFTTAVTEALALAEAANEVNRAFRAWARESRLTEAGLHALAGELWSCQPDETDAEARRRGLFRSHGFSPGLRGALELVAPAERLRPPINGYRRRRARLRAASLDYALPRAFAQFEVPANLTSDQAGTRA